MTRFILGAIRLLTAAFVALLTVTTGLAGLLAVILVVYPAALLNDFTLNTVPDAASLAGVELRWSEGHLDVRSESWRVKAFELDLADVCVETKTLDACFEDVDLGFALRLYPWSRTIARLGPGKILGGNVNVIPGPPAPEPEEPAEPTDWDALANQILSVDIRPLEVELKRWRVAGDKQDISGRTHLTLVTKEDGNRWTLEVTGKDLKGVPLKGGRVEVRVAGLADQNIMKTKIDLAANGELIERGRFDVKAHLVPEDEKPSRVELDADYRVKKQRFTFAADGTVSPEKAQGSYSFQASHLVEALDRLALEPCRFEAEYGEERDFALDFQTQCSGKGVRANLHNEERFQVVLPKTFLFDAKSHITVKEDGESRRFTNTSSVDLVKIRSGALEFQGGAQANASGVLDRIPESLSGDLRFDLTAQVPQFAELVAQLRRTQWAIPAPANALKGSAQCSVKGTYNTSKDKTTLPLACRTELASKQQKLHTQTDGQLVFRKVGDRFQPSVDADVRLQRVRVVLPDLGLRAKIPTLVQDGRIKIPEPEPAEDEDKLPLSYDISVKTDRPGAVKIATGITERAVPLNIDIALARDRPLTGSISINDYTAEIFRREALVESFQVKFLPDTDVAELDGRVIVDVQQYEITLLVVGSTKEPTIKLLSSPPLEDQEIIALLLFGRSPDNLASEEKRSIEETQAAVADDAIGLVSMYYLASTPIESVGYNPATGMFTAQVSLGEGLSLTLGTERGAENRVGLRKRLGGNWSVETTAVKDKDDDSTKGVAMFTWSNRY